MGQFFSILCAVVWAVAVILFRKSGEKVHPLALNLFKNSLAIVLFIPTVFLFGEKLFFPASAREYLILLASGAIGIAFGDTLYFLSLNALGAGLTGIVVCMGSPFIIFFSILLLHERFTFWQAVGAALIVGAVLLSSIEKSKDKIERSRILKGVLFGIAAAATSAAGVVLMKPVLTVSPLVWATEVRLVGGIVVLAVIFLLFPGRGRIFRTMFEARTWPFMVSSSFLGAYVAMLIWLAGMKYTFASTSSALNQTSTIFIFIFAGIFLKEPVNLRRITGIIAAFAGVLLVIFCGAR